MKQDRLTDARQLETLRRVAHDTDYIRYLKEQLEGLTAQLIVADRMEDLRSLQGMARGYQKILSELERHRT